MQALSINKISDSDNKTAAVFVRRLFLLRRARQHTTRMENEASYIKKNVPWHILALRRGCFSNHLPLRRVRILAERLLSYENEVFYTIIKKGHAAHPEMKSMSFFLFKEIYF